MKHQLHALEDLAQGAASIEADALLLLLDQAQLKALGGKAAAKTALGKWLAAALAAKDFSGAKGEVLQAYQATGFVARRVLLVGCEQGQARQEAAAVQTALAQCAGKGISSIAIAGFNHLQAVVGAAAAALYAYDLTLAKKNPRATQSLHFYQGKADKTAKAEFALALAQAEGVQLARELGNMPANYATPTHLAQTAQKLAAGSKNLICKVLEKRDAEKLKMGAFLSVAAASAQAPKFIELKYTGAGKAAPVVLVGKGITFDTGGISLKPGAGMDEMKYDMCGAASVLGVFAALARLQPKKELQLLAGFVTGIRVKVGNRGKMAFVQLDDGSAKLEVSIFAEAFEANRTRLKEDTVLVVEGKVSNDDFSGGLRIVVDKLYDLGEARSRFARSLLLTMNGNADVGRLKNVLSPFRAQESGCPVRVSYSKGTARGDLLLSPEWGVRLDDGLLLALRDWLGQQAVRVIW